MMAQWQKGVSGNPGGRPKAHGDIRELARQHTQAAIDTLVAVMSDTQASASSRVSAATALLDRAYGRPTYYLESTVTRDPREMTDEELLAIIETGREQACASEHAEIREHRHLEPVTG